MATGELLGSLLIGYYPLQSDGQNYLDGGERNNEDKNMKFSKGKFGACADFTFSGSALNLKYPLDKNEHDFSMSCFVWIKAYDPRIEPGDHGSWVTVAGRLRLRNKDGKVLYFFTVDRGGKVEAIQIMSNGSISAGEWHSIIISYAGNENRLKIYIDGQLDSVHKLDQIGWQKDDKPRLQMASIGGEYDPRGGPQTTLNGHMCHLFLFRASLSRDAINLLTVTRSLPSIEIAEKALLKKEVKPGDLKPRFLPALAFAIPAFLTITGISVSAKMISDSQDGHPEEDQMKKAQALADKIKSFVGDPATADRSKFPTRQMCGIKSVDKVHLDIGGEGAHFDGQMHAGYPGAVNINAQANNSQTRTPIPALVRLGGYSDKFPYPVANEFADYLTMQGAPLNDYAVPEFVRVLRPGGEIGLWIDPEAFKNQIAALAKALNSTAQHPAHDEKFQDYSFKKTSIIDRRHDEL